MRLFLSSLFMLLSGANLALAQNAIESGWLDADHPSRLVGQKHAILLRVGQHKSRPKWDLPFTQSDHASMELILRESLHFSAVTQLANESVTSPAIQSAVEKAMASFSGTGNVLLVYWSGHGWVDQGNELQLLTSFSDLRKGPGETAYTLTLGESELAGLLDEPTKDPGTTVVVILDCCRVPTMGPTGRKPAEVQLGNARIYAAEPGKPAYPNEDQSRSEFSEAVEKATLKMATKSELSMGQWFDAIKSEMERVEEQTPVIRSEDKIREVPLYDHGNLSLRIEVVDALSGEPIRNAAIEIGGSTYESPAILQDLTVGQYRPDVRYPGFCRQREIIELNERTSGGVFRVAMRPSFHDLRGRVSDAEGRPAPETEVSLSGSRGSFREGYHHFTASTDSLGDYSFRIPPDAQVTAVSVRVDRKKTQSHDFRYEDLKSISDPSQSSHEVYELPTIALLPDTVLPGALGLFDVNLRMWEAAEEHLAVAEINNLATAMDYYRQLISRVSVEHQELVKRRFRAAGLQLLPKLRAKGRYKRGQRVARGALELLPEDPQIRQWLAEFEREDIPKALRVLFKKANHDLQRERKKQAEQKYRDLRASIDELTPYYARRVIESHEALVDELFLAAFDQIDPLYLAGEQRLATDYYFEALLYKPKDPSLISWHRNLREIAEDLKGFRLLRRNETTNLEEYIHQPSGLEFVLIPSGTFIMGSPKGESQRQDDEADHLVELSDFLISKHEVSESVWGRVMRVLHKRGAGDLPVTGVSWNQVHGGKAGSPDPHSFCGRTGLSLPTEAQWEFACRAGNQGPFAFGGYLRRTQAHFAVEGEPKRVDAFSPNAYSLFNMHGNALEWCLDFYGLYPEGSVQNPSGPTVGTKRVVRGGHWGNRASDCRSARRRGLAPHESNRFLGFRVARSLSTRPK